MNEVETTVTKAAQGRNLDFGIAVEIGAAARWLCARGFDGITEAAGVLSVAVDSDSDDSDSDDSDSDDSDIDDSDRVVNRLGLSAVDLAAASARSVHTTDCSSPLMLRALAARVDCSVYFDPSADHGEGAWIVDPHGGADDIAPTESITPAPPAWEQISKWAALTYVPGSAHSRSTGAGAGLTDSD